MTLDLFLHSGRWWTSSLDQLLWKWHISKEYNEPWPNPSPNLLAPPTKRIRTLTAKEMKHQKLTPNEVALSAAISACEKGKQWQWALHVLYASKNGFRKWPARWWFERIFHFDPDLEKWSNLTNIFQMCWNHQLLRSYVARRCVKKYDSGIGIWTSFIPAYPPIQFDNYQITFEDDVPFSQGGCLFFGQQSKSVKKYFPEIYWNVT